MERIKNRDYAIKLLSDFAFDGEFVLASSTVYYEGANGLLFSHTVSSAREDFTNWGEKEWDEFIDKSREFYGDVLKRVESITLSFTPGGFENYILEATDLDMAGFNRVVITHNPPFFPKQMFMLTTDEQKYIGSASSVLLASKMITPERLISIDSDEPVAIIVRRIAKNLR